MPRIDPERPVEPPETEDFYCPCCGAENPEHIILGVNREVLGCDECLSIYQPQEYFEGGRE